MMKATKARSRQSARTVHTANHAYGACTAKSTSLKRKHIAIVTMGVKLGDEVRGYMRFRFLADLLVRQGFDVDLITSSFQHWDKAQRDCSKACYREAPYRIVFIEEPGYAKNLDLRRIRSHAIAARNLQTHLSASTGTYDLIYAEIPPNDVARICAEFAHEQNLPFIADINDLWPEAMRMVINIPLISDIAFRPFTRDVNRVYELLSGAVGTSEEYAQRPVLTREEPYPHRTVYVGNDLDAFDEGVTCHREDIEKPADEFWITYAGTLGSSYDLETLIDAAPLLEKGTRIKILGDGPKKAALQARAARLDASVDFLGYLDYGRMAAYLTASDMVVNSLVKKAAQGIVTKIGDYLASGNPLINTGSNREFRAKVAADGFGINVEAGNPYALADAIETLLLDPGLRKSMGKKGRAIAEREFNQSHSYLAIVDLIRELL